MRTISLPQHSNTNGWINRGGADYTTLLKRKLQLNFSITHELLTSSGFDLLEYVTVRLDQYADHEGALARVANFTPLVFIHIGLNLPEFEHMIACSAVAEYLVPDAA